MSKNKIILTKLFTRPWNFAAVEGYSKAITFGLPKISGFQFSGNYVYWQAGLFDIYRNTEESEQGIAEILIPKIRRGDFNFDKFIADYKVCLGLVKRLLKKYQQPKTFGNNAQMVADLSSFSRAWQWGGAAMNIIYWLGYHYHKKDKFYKMMPPVARRCARWREKTDQFYYFGVMFFQLFVSRIASCERLDINLVESLSDSEITDYFKHKKLPSRQALKQRWQKGVGLFNGQVMPRAPLKIKQLLAGQGFILAPSEKAPIEWAGVLKGTTVYSGRAKGAVRICRHYRDCDQVRSSEIIVSPMTTPMFLAGIKKAKALITDEGGLLSHAAIVARELKKPCVVDTKVATQVLKDGDKVEVDAYKGIVKKLR